MNIPLTWDLVIVCAFMLIFGYHFMLGQRDTVKLIICTYISMMAADGVAGILKTYLIDPSVGIQEWIADKELTIFTWLRLSLFLFTIILFVVKSGFHVHLQKHNHWAVRTGIHALFAAISGLLMLSTILVYLSGISMTEGMIYARELNIYQSSFMARILIDHLQIWFTLPALAFLVTSFFYDARDMD